MGIEELKKQIEDIVDRASLIYLKETVDNRLRMLGEMFWPSKNQDIVNAKLKEYETVKDFIRHYSVTRSAVLTFLVGLSFGITGAFVTKADSLETNVVYIAYSLALAVLIIAIFFDRILYKYLTSTWNRGNVLEGEINTKLNSQKGLGILTLKFYGDGTGTGKPNLPKYGGPTFCLWGITLAYIFFGFIGIPLLDP